MGPEEASGTSLASPEDISTGAIIASVSDQGTKNQLIEGNLEEDVVRELKLRAARHGRSAEAEHRDILRQALLPQKPKRSLKDLLLAMPTEGTEEDFKREPDHGRDVEI